VERIPFGDTRNIVTPRTTTDITTTEYYRIEQNYNFNFTEMQTEKTIREQTITTTTRSPITTAIDPCNDKVCRN